MPLLEIVKWPDVRLSTVCDPVGPGDDLATLARDMLDTMYDAPGRGLAAPQVGVLKRLFVMDITWKEGTYAPMICMNPRISERSDDVEFGDEGCLSIPGVLVAVERPVWVVLEWIDEQKVEHSERLEGFAARCAQHELDHLDGIVTFQHLDITALKAAEAEYFAA